MRNFRKKLAILITKVNRHSVNSSDESKYWASKQQWFSAVDWAWGWAQTQKQKKKINNGVKSVKFNLQVKIAFKSSSD